MSTKSTERMPYFNSIKSYQYKYNVSNRIKCLLANTLKQITKNIYTTMEIIRANPLFTVNIFIFLKPVFGRNLN